MNKLKTYKGSHNILLGESGVGKVVDTGLRYFTAN